MAKTPTDATLDDLAKFIIEKNTPLPGNKCKEKGCGGTVVRKVVSLFRGRFGALPPACDTCGRTYFHADVPMTGQDEFVKNMRRPMTI